MSSFRQIEANRRNARLSTGPITEEGKRRSRQNAPRHGLTAETVITALEDAEDYKAFELAVTADYDAQTAVERELVLRLASLLWRLRRASAIESGLFNVQAKHLLQLGRRRRTHQARQDIIDNLRHAVPMRSAETSGGTDLCIDGDHSQPSRCDRFIGFDDLTRSYVRLTKLPSRPLDRLSRYECTLWRQARQTLVSLQTLDRSRRKEERNTRLW